MGTGRPPGAARPIQASLNGGRPTLLSVRPPADEADSTDPVARGEAAIEAAAERAGLDADRYDASVVVGDDAAVLDAVTDRGVVCLGMTGPGEVDAGRGRTFTERIAARTDGDVAVAKAGDDGRRSAAAD